MTDISKILFPRPKNVTFRDGTLPLPLTYDAEAGFLPAARAFAELLERECSISLSEGEGGIRLVKGDGAEEAYTLSVSADGITLCAATEKGINRGLSTLYQLITNTEAGMPYLEIEDAPDASYRGLMVDLARAWHEPDWLFRYVDLCWKCRASHLQLHFTDNEAFTLPIDAFPDIGTQRYTKEDIAKLVEYAHVRGITLVPEIDLPGHTLPWMRAYPALFGKTNVLAASEDVFDALCLIFTELHEMFPHSPWIHIGGDEADASQWEKCPITQAFMKQNGIESVGEMYAEYVRRTAELVLEMGCTPVVWEGFAKEYNDRIPKETVVIAWESLYQTPDDIAAAGFSMINCSWVPLYICTNGRYWSPEEILQWDMWTFKNWWEESKAYPDGIVIPRETSHVLGGQICVWGDYLHLHGNLADSIQTEYRLMSERLPALCERTWNL